MIGRLAHTALLACWLSQAAPNVTMSGINIVGTTKSGGEEFFGGTCGTNSIFLEMTKLWQVFHMPNRLLGIYDFDHLRRLTGQHEAIRHSVLPTLGIDVCKAVRVRQLARAPRKTVLPSMFIAQPAQVPEQSYPC
jgi:hypothetical protein